MKRIPLWQNGQVAAYALVDDNFRTKHYWLLSAHNRAIRYTGPTGRTVVFMSRQIMGLKKGDRREVDHKNRNRLDNRRCNLRVVTRAENAQNLTPQTGRSSKHPGVSWRSDRQKWRAYGKKGGKQFCLGHFKTEREAVITASLWRRQNMPFAVED